MKRKVKITTLEKILDMLYPCYCWGCGMIGEIFCARCYNYNRCENPPFLMDFNDFGGQIFVCGLREGVLKKMVHEYKFNSRRELSSLFAKMIDDVVPRKKFVIVPLPTIQKHVRVRGFDHIGRIAEGLASLRGATVLKALIREKNTVQVGSSRELRMTQAERAYGLAPGVKIDPEAEYLLLDDVWTTGASMRAAAKVFRDNGAKKISGVVIVKNAAEV